MSYQLFISIVLVAILVHLFAIWWDLGHIRMRLRKIQSGMEKCHARITATDQRVKATMMILGFTERESPGHWSRSLAQQAPSIQKPDGRD